MVVHTQLVCESHSFRGTFVFFVIQGFKIHIKELKCSKNIFHFTQTEDYPTWVNLTPSLKVNSGESRSWCTQFAAHLSSNQRCLCQIVYLWPRILACRRQSLSHTVLLCLTYWMWTWPTWLFSSVSGTMAASTVLIYDQVWWRGSQCS